MRALVFTGPGTLELQEVEEPAAGQDEVLVHVRVAGICGSELHGVRNPGFRKPPLIMGHEFSGVTEDGRRVTVNPIISCGHCELCQAGLRQVCRERAIIGIHRPGGFAERVAVPAEALRPVPATLSWEAAALIEPAANAVHAWGLAATPDGARVGVIGAGAIGLACLLMAVSSGAGSVDVVDRSGQRLAVAKQLGASSTGSALTSEYDVIFDAVGSIETHNQSVDRLRPGGVAIWLGLAADTAGFDAAALVRTEKRVIGSFAYTDEDFARSTTLVQQWDLSWAAAYPLVDGARVFTELMNGSTHPVKALLRP